MERSFHISAILSAVTGHKLTPSGDIGMDHLIKLSNFVMNTNHPLWSEAELFYVKMAMMQSMRTCKEFILKQYPALENISIPDFEGKSAEFIECWIKEVQKQIDLPDEVELKAA